MCLTKIYNFLLLCFGFSQRTLRAHQAIAPLPKKNGFTNFNSNKCSYLYLNTYIHTRNIEDEFPMGGIINHFLNIMLYMYNRYIAH